MLSFFFAFCNMELSVWHVMSEIMPILKLYYSFLTYLILILVAKLEKNLVTLRSKRRKNCSKA